MFFFLIIFIFVFTGVSTVNAYCIFNRHTDNTYIWVRQVSNAGGNYFQRFKHDQLGPNDKVCCPYTNEVCVRSTSKEDIIFFSMQQTFPSGKHPYFEVNCPGGGWIEVGGNETKPTLDVYYADGQPFKFEFRYTLSTSVFD